MRELTPEEAQLITSHRRIEREFAAERGCEPDATREEVRTFLATLPYPERETLRERKRHATERLASLMEVEPSEITSGV